jgi:capsid protein
MASVATPVEGGDDGQQSSSDATARCGPREDEIPVASSRPVSLGARDRLRDHHAAAAKAVATHAAATARLDAVLSRRAKVLASQDCLVDAAKADVEAAVAAVAGAMGVEVAADVLGLNRAEVRRIAKDNQ